MTYQETLDFLFSQLPMYQKEGKSAYKKDLGNTLALMEALDNPHRKFKSVHIAGTNGKGMSTFESLPVVISRTAASKGPTLIPMAPAATKKALALVMPSKSTHAEMS